MNIQSTRLIAHVFTHRTIARRDVVLGLGISGLILVTVTAGVLFSQRLLPSGIGWLLHNLQTPEATLSMITAVGLASATALVSMALGTAMAVLLPRDVHGQSRISIPLELPMAVPSVVTIVTVLILWNPVANLGVLTGNTAAAIWLVVPILLVAHVVLTTPRVVNNVASAIRGVGESQREAAEVLGAGKIDIFFNVIMHPIKGVLLSSTIWIFARSVGEFAATITLFGILALHAQGTPLFIFSQIDRSGVEAVFAVAGVLITLSFALLIVSKSMSTRSIVNVPQIEHDQ